MEPYSLKQPRVSCPLPDHREEKKTGCLIGGFAEPPGNCGGSTEHQGPKVRISTFLGAMDRGDWFCVLSNRWPRRKTSEFLFPVGKQHPVGRMKGGHSPDPTKHSPRKCRDKGMPRKKCICLSRQPSIIGPGPATGWAPQSWPTQTPLFEAVW